MKLTIQLVDDAGHVFAGEALLERISGKAEKQVHKESSTNERNPGKVKCPFALECLWKKEKFKQALSFLEVKTALTTDGYNFPMNTLMMALQNASFLTRRGGRGNYTWTQKYPFNH
jgi:hypothetical protein